MENENEIRKKIEEKERLEKESLKEEIRKMKIEIIRNNEEKFEIVELIKIKKQLEDTQKAKRDMKGGYDMQIGEMQIQMQRNQREVNHKSLIKDNTIEELEKNCNKLEKEIKELGDEISKNKKIIKKNDEEKKLEKINVKG